jgi:cell division protease FtsH
LVKVTIVPRGKALGAAWYLPEERQITTYEQMFDEMTSALGGRASEEIIFGKVSTGALNDLEKVTKQAYAMVVFYGLNAKIGNISFYDSSGQQEYSFNKPFSEKTAEVIDQEISKLVEEGYQRAKKILLENRDKLEQLALQLLKKEVIFREDLEVIFGRRPFDVPTEMLGDAENGDNLNNVVIAKSSTKTIPEKGPEKEKAPEEPVSPEPGIAESNS